MSVLPVPSHDDQWNDSSGLYGKGLKQSHPGIPDPTGLRRLHQGGGPRDRRWRGAPDHPTVVGARTRGQHWGNSQREWPPGGLRGATYRRPVTDLLHREAAHRRRRRIRRRAGRALLGIIAPGYPVHRVRRQHERPPHQGGGEGPEQEHRPLPWAGGRERQSHAATTVPWWSAEGKAGSWQGLLLRRDAGPLLCRNFACCRPTSARRRSTKRCKSTLPAKTSWSTRTSGSRFRRACPPGDPSGRPDTALHARRSRFRSFHQAGRALSGVFRCLSRSQDHTNAGQPRNSLYRLQGPAGVRHLWWARHRRDLGCSREGRDQRRLVPEMGRAPSPSPGGRRRAGSPMEDRRHTPAPSGRVQRVLCQILAASLDASSEKYSRPSTTSDKDKILLSQAFPEGSRHTPPTRPAMARSAGACIAVLKFFFDCDHRFATFAQPVVPSEDGLKLLPYVGNDANEMTINGELHKLAHNISFGHGIHAGIHWRSDTDKSIIFGEQVAISCLSAIMKTYSEKASISITLMDGTLLTFSN